MKSETQGNTRKRASCLKYSKYIFAILIACTLFSIYYLIYVQSLPTTTTKRTVYATYQQAGNYDYVAKLRPNLIYNKDLLRPNEGTLYTKITDYVDVAFTYRFSSLPNYSNMTVRRQLTVQIESPGIWTRTLTDQEASDIFNVTGGVDFSMRFNSTRVKEFSDVIDSEIGVTTNKYSVKVSPFIQISINVGGEIVNDFLNPKLTIQFGERRDETTNTLTGNYISFDGLSNSEYQEISQDEVLAIPGSQERLYIMYAITAVLGLSLITYAIYYVRSTPREKPSKHKKILSEYHDLMTESTGSPPESKTTIIETKIEDIAKIAEIIGKPIIHLKTDSMEIYYVLDGETKYIYELGVE